MDTQCTPPRSAHTHSQHIDADESACGFGESLYLDLARKAILAVYADNGWEGEAEDDGDIHVWSEHGDAWFTNIRYKECDSSHTIVLQQQWHRPDGTIPVNDWEHNFNFHKRTKRPTDGMFDKATGATRGVDQFYTWMVGCIGSPPHLFGPDYFEWDFETDPFFEIPNFAGDDDEDEEDDGERYGYDDDDLDEDEAPSEIDRYWKLPRGTRKIRAAGRENYDGG